MRIFLFAIASSVAASSMAQSLPPASEAIDEVVVTARLREEAARDVPFALTALDAQTLTARRIDDTQSLFRQAPGLSLTSFDDGRFAYFQLRGIGPLGQAISPDDGSVVTYVDGVPQPVYASEFAYLDLQRIEVLHNVDVKVGGRVSNAEIYLFARNLFDSDQHLNGVLYGPGIAAASFARGRIAGVGFTATFQ